jgi:restriction endonuclease Mrr
MLSADWLKAVHANAERNRRLLEDFDAETRAIMARNVARYLQQEKETMDKNRKRFGTNLKNVVLSHREASHIASGLGLSQSSAPEAFIDDLLPELADAVRQEVLGKVRQKDPALFETMMLEAL